MEISNAVHRLVTLGAAKAGSVSDDALILEWLASRKFIGATDRAAWEALGQSTLVVLRLSYPVLEATEKKLEPQPAGATKPESST